MFNWRQMDLFFDPKGKANPLVAGDCRVSGDVPGVHMHSSSNENYEEYASLVEPPGGPRARVRVVRQGN